MNHRSLKDSKVAVMLSGQELNRYRPAPAANDALVRRDDPRLMIPLMFLC